jgi:beta-phosphoglucomutase-like phosphatase (HAD superfamily)
MMVTVKNGLLAHLDRPFALEDLFQVVLSGTDVARTKPAPDIYLLAAERMGVSPSRCVAFEDSEAGVRSAKSAGMTVIAVPNVFTAHQDHSSADVCLSSLADAVKDGLL